MTRASTPYIVLAAAVGLPAGLCVGALVPAVAIAVLCTNLALYTAYRIGTKA